MSENQINRTTAILNIVLKAYSDTKALEYLDKIANIVCHAVLLKKNTGTIQKHLTLKEIYKETDKELLPMSWVTNPDGLHSETTQQWVGDPLYLCPSVKLNDLAFLLTDVSNPSIEDRYRYRYILSIDTYNKLKKLIECFRQNKRPSKKIWAWLIGDEAETASE
ncbi:hypothetical protein [Gilliamella sp. GillExp13]|uniref:hypothetical protein n=1 Tax=Gilliamella sp. GillExp13 TaxID=3120243 RepID=UPI00080DA624|nr:hypothetical protein [Gilliamella apicola]OCG58723.1 hypothetical protein A9G37_06425 [Gilliamella apicola]